MQQRHEPDERKGKEKGGGGGMGGMGGYTERRKCETLHTQYEDLIHGVIFRSDLCLSVHMQLR